MSKNQNLSSIINRGTPKQSANNPNCYRVGGGGGGLYSGGYKNLTPILFLSFFLSPLPRNSVKRKLNILYSLWTSTLPRAWGIERFVRCIFGKSIIVHFVILIMKLTFAEFFNIFQQLPILLWSPRSFVYFRIQGVHPSKQQETTKPRNKLSRLECLLWS